MKIFIYGVPGVGKTTFSRYLKTKLNYPLIELDYLRFIAQLGKSITENYFLYVGTTEAWRHYGDINEENVIRGLNVVRACMKPYVMNEISLYNEIDSIFEGAFIIPEDLVVFGKVVLIVNQDEEKHKMQFFEHREMTAKTQEEFMASRMIQDEFIKQAKKMKDIIVIENSGNINDIIEDLSF